MNVHPEDVEGALVAAGLAEPIAFETEQGRIGVAVRSGVAIGAPDGRRGAGDGAAVRVANRRLAQHQKVAGWAAYPDADFPRTHTLKVQRVPWGCACTGWSSSWARWSAGRVRAATGRGGSVAAAEAGRRPAACSPSSPSARDQPQQDQPFADEQDREDEEHRAQRPHDPRIGAPVSAPRDAPTASATATLEPTRQA